MATNIDRRGKGTFGWRVCALSAPHTSSEAATASPRGFVRRGSFFRFGRGWPSDGQVVILGTPIARSMTHVAICAPVRVFDAAPRPVGPGNEMARGCNLFR